MCLKDKVRLNEKKSPQLASICSHCTKLSPSLKKWLLSLQGRGGENKKQL